MKMMAGRILLTIVAVLAGAGSAAAQQARSLAPTEVLHLMLQEMLAHPDRPQPENTRRFVPLARTDGLSREERSALAEAYFLAFMPRESKALYEQELEGSDLLSRLAWQRVIRMTFAAEDRHADAEKMLEEFYRRFKPTPEDASYGAQNAGNQAQRYRDAGDLEKAMQFVVREVEALPFDAPYSGFLLLGQYYHVFLRAGKGEQAEQLTIRAIEGLKDTARREGITDNPYVQNNRGVGLAHSAGVLHAFGDGLLQDDPAFDRREYLRGRIHTMITQLEAMLARMKSGAGDGGG